MKVAIVHDSKKRVIWRRGNVRAIVVFHWYRVERDEDGWTLQLFSFLTHITEDLEWFGYFGVLNFGWHDGRLAFCFAPGPIPPIAIGGGQPD